MNNTTSETLKTFIAGNSDLSYEEASAAVDKYFETDKKKVKYEDDIPFHSPNSVVSDE
jgi:hypothetical protein